MAPGDGGRANGAKWGKTEQNGAKGATNPGNKCNTVQRVVVIDRQ